MTEAQLWRHCDELVCRLVKLTHAVDLPPEHEAARIARYKLLAWAPDQPDEQLVQEVARTFMRLEPACSYTLATADL